MLRRLWADHSLTIVTAVLGAVFIAIAIPLREGTAFDVIVGFGHGCGAVALYNIAAGWLKEKNKPEK
jgi:hypothetical protein